MDGPKWYYAKQHDSERERPILYHLTYTWNLKRVLIETENRLVGTVEWGNWSEACQRAQTFSSEMSNFWTPNL